MECTGGQSCKCLTRRGAWIWSDDVFQAVAQVEQVSPSKKYAAILQAAQSVLKSVLRRGLLNVGMTIEPVIHVGVGYCMAYWLPEQMAPLVVRIFSPTNISRAV